jgi:hypothetical protein
VTGAVQSVPGGAAGLAAVLLLLSLLAVREVVAAAGAPWAARLDRALRVAIIPPALLFFAIAAARLLQLVH